MFRCLLHGSRPRQQLSAIDLSDDLDIGDSHATFGDRAGLVDGSGLAGAGGTWLITRFV